MSNDINPADIDIDYLHQHANRPVTNADEDAFIELCGKNYSDGMTDLQARVEAIKVFNSEVSTDKFMVSA